MPAPIKWQQLPWCSGGLSEHQAFSAQEKDDPRSGNRQTTADCRNVRNYDPATGRLRGSQRCGHSKYVATQPNGSNAIQHLNHLVSLSQVGTGVSATRTMKSIVVVAGNVYLFTTAGFTLATNGTAALSSSFQYLNSAENYGQFFFVDGTNYKYWDSITNTVLTWAASSPSALPSNGAALPRLICTWRGRVVLSGILGDGQNWFMSRQGDAFDWDTGTDPIDETMAVIGNSSEAGLCQDVVTALIPFNDDLMWFGGDHTIWQMTNDPMAGGRLDLVSDQTGIAFGTAWCKDPSGLIYFWGSRGGLYVMVPGQLPKSLSASKLQERFAKIDLSLNVVRLAWDDRQQNVHIYISPLSAGATVHYIYDVRNGAFWPDTFTNTGHNPKCCHVMDGDDPTDRVLLLGCQDGYIRKLDLTATNDDGTAISSYVFLGPIQDQFLDIRLLEMQATLGENSDPVGYSLYRGNSAEDALTSTAFWTGTWTSGRQKAEKRMASGTLYMKMSNSNSARRWNVENINIATQVIGRASSRAF